MPSQSATTNTACADTDAPVADCVLVTLLNSAVLTADGEYEMRSITLEAARALLRQRGFASALGHEATAHVMSALLGIDCPVRRVTYRQPRGASALVLRLNQRLDQGRVLCRVEEIEAIGYSLSLLHRRS